METVNFFWRGKDFGILENMVLKSHIKVGHKPIIWLSGLEPNGFYWNEIQKLVVVKDANEVCNVEDFLSAGGNFRTAASLWRFNFLFKNGGLYCDCDAFALKKFPDDDWIVCSERNDDTVLSIGVLKAPPKQKIFSDCILNVNNEWGNVKIFTDSYQKHFGHTKSTHNSLLFYPYKWRDCEILFKKTEIPSNVFSIHFYTKALQRNILKSNKGLFDKIHLFKKIRSIEEINESWCRKNHETLLGKLFSWLNER